MSSVLFFPYIEDIFSETMKHVYHDKMAFELVDNFLINRATLLWNEVDRANRSVIDYLLRR